MLEGNEEGRRGRRLEEQAQNAPNTKNRITGNNVH